MEKRSSPVQQACARFGELLAGLDDPALQLPSERQLAQQWGISHAAVNRAVQQLMASGRLRRKGYRLFPGDKVDPVAGISLAVLTHRSHRYPMLETLAASLGIRACEFFYVGRDSLHTQLRKVLEEGFDAVVMQMTDGGWEWDEEAREFAQKRIPLILGEPGPSVYPMVTEDWAGAAAMAVEKLIAAGHRELVFLGSLRRAHRSNVVERGYVETCLRLGLAKSAGRNLRFTSHYADNIKEASRAIPLFDPPPTACLLYDVDHLADVIEGLGHAGLQVPGDLSLVAVGDHPNAIHMNPPVTCMAFNTKALTRLILAEVVLLVDEARSVAPVLSMPRIKLEPVWRERGSVAQLGTGAGVPDFDVLVTNTTSKNWPTELQERRREVEKINHQSHALALGLSSQAFAPVSLAEWANRSISRQNSWLGHAPLSHLAPGPTTIHGVPFELLDEKEHAGKAAIVLQPQHPETCNITIPLGRQVRGIYILHACGFVGQPIPFGWYDFVFKDGRTQTVPLTARGLGVLQQDGHKPNIQDWWNDFPQIEGPGFKHFVLTENNDPLAYERYLYTLEWVNPHPRKELKELRMSINPARRTVLGILGITLLKAGEKNAPPPTPKPRRPSPKA